MWLCGQFENLTATGEWTRPFHLAKDYLESSGQVSDIQLYFNMLVVVSRFQCMNRQRNQN